MRFFRFSALVFALTALSTLPVALGSSAPQERPVNPPPIISVETNLVLLPVTVLDRKGAFVSGLKQSDFTIYDNGEPRPIEFFTSEDVPATIGLVIDCSGSMGTMRAEVTAAGVAFAASSHPLDELFTVNFNEHVWPGLPVGVDFAREPDELRAALSRAPAVGLTALYDALHEALDHLERGTRDRKVLIVVSDGGDNASSRTLASVLERARRANTVIHAIALDADDPDARPRVLKELASLTGGDFFRPAHVQDVVKAFTHVAQDIRSGYTIGFAPPDESNAGFRSVRVVVNAHGSRPLVVRTRAGYDLGRRR